MYEFKLLLNSFAKGEADLDDLIRKIKRLAIEDANTVQDALRHCEHLSEKGLLTTHVYNRLKHEAAGLQSEEATRLKPDIDKPKLEATRLKPDISKTRLVEKTVIRKRNTQTDIDKTELIEKSTILTPITQTDASDLSETLLTNTQQDHNLEITLESGSKLKNRFVLVEEIGRGGMGVVYKARDFRREETQDNEPFVAIKVLAREFQVHKISVIALQRETKKAQNLAHPNIITVFDFDRDGENVFMTMEYLEGETLDIIIKKSRGKLIERKQALSIIEQMGRALAYAHKKGIVHSDFKPGNVFVTNSEVVKILDFGIARAAKLPEQNIKEDTVFDAGDLNALTPVYASKEMLEGKDPDPRDDIYGLAVVACLLLTGKHPFERIPANKAHAQGFKPLHIDKLPRSIKNALVHALAFEREKRTASATQFLQELNLRPRKRKSLKRRLLEIATISLFMLGTIYSIYELSNNAPAEIILEETASISDPEIRQKVETLLEIADVHIMVKRLMDPPGSSALYAYQQVLEYHDTNRQAHEGLRKIADYYEKAARESLDSGDHERAIQLVDKSLTAFPSHEGLNSLRNELTNPQ